MNHLRRKTYQDYVSALLQVSVLDQKLFFYSGRLCQQTSCKFFLDFNHLLPYNAMLKLRMKAKNQQLENTPGNVFFLQKSWVSNDAKDSKILFK